MKDDSFYCWHKVPFGDGKFCTGCGGEIVKTQTPKRQKTMSSSSIQLKNLKNGKLIKVGSTVLYGGEKCSVVAITSEHNIELERLSDGVGWDMVEAKYINCVAFNPLDKAMEDKPFDISTTAFDRGEDLICPKGISKAQKPLKRAIGAVSDGL